MKLPASIKQGTEFSPAAVEQLRNEVQIHLKNMRLDRAAILAVRAEPLFPPPDQEDRFRDRERDENTKCILQHLLSFLDLVPGTVQYENPELNPIGQFRH
jgi:hypothetical protein